MNIVAKVVTTCFVCATKVGSVCDALTFSHARIRHSEFLHTIADDVSENVFGC